MMKQTIQSKDKKIQELNRKSIHLENKIKDLTEREAKYEKRLT